MGANKVTQTDACAHARTRARARTHTHTHAHSLNTHTPTPRSNQAQIKTALGGKAADSVKGRIAAIVQEVRGAAQGSTAQDRQDSIGLQRWGWGSAGYDSRC